MDVWCLFPLLCSKHRVHHHHDPARRLPWKVYHRDRDGLGVARDSESGDRSTAESCLARESELFIAAEPIRKLCQRVVW